MPFQSQAVGTQGIGPRLQTAVGEKPPKRLTTNGTFFVSTFQEKRRDFQGNITHPLQNGPGNRTKNKGNETLHWSKDYGISDKDKRRRTDLNRRGQIIEESYQTLTFQNLMPILYNLSSQGCTR